MNISTIIFLCCLATCTISVDLTAAQKYARHLDAGGKKASGLCERCSAWWHKQTHSSTVMVGDQTMPRNHLEQLIANLREIELDTPNKARFVAISHLAHTRKMVDDTTGDLKQEIKEFLQQLQAALGISCFRRKTFREKMIHALPFVIQKKSGNTARRTLEDSFLHGTGDSGAEDEEEETASYETLSIEQVLGEIEVTNAPAQV